MTGLWGIAPFSAKLESRAQDTTLLTNCRRRMQYFVLKDRCPVKRQNPSEWRCYYHESRAQGV